MTHDALAPRGAPARSGRWPGSGTSPCPVAYASRIPSSPMILPPVGRSGPGMNRISSVRPASGWRIRCRRAWTTSTRLCGAQLVAMPDRDAGGAVDQQVGERGGQDGRLDVLAVVVGLEVDGVLVEPVGHRQGGGGHPALGVAHGGRTVVERAEVAVAVDQRQPHGPRLGGADQGVVDRACRRAGGTDPSPGRPRGRTSRGCGRAGCPSRPSSRGSGAGPASARRGRQAALGSR